MTAVETVWVDYEALMHEREQRQDDDEELSDRADAAKQPRKPRSRRQCGSLSLAGSGRAVARRPRCSASPHR